MVPHHFRPDVSFLAPKFNQIIENRIAALAGSVRRERGSPTGRLYPRTIAKRQL